MFCSRCCDLLVIVFASMFFSFPSTVECWYKLAPGQENDELQVHLHNGLIQGVQLQTLRGANYSAYRGVPYAAAPVEELRFKPPKDVPNWDGILDATVDGAACHQLRSETDDESEDCLFINVYTTLNKEQRLTEKQPVMVWIYGGAFVSGHSKSSLYGPDYLLEKGVVVVTFNYRVGIFGFLSTQDLNAPGNYGLKDQIAALRWINQNIHLFGGDRNNVTIFGESAGGASVSYMLIAPKAKGLFHRAISESGSALCPWALQRTPKNIAFQVGTALGIITFSSEHLIQRLRNVSATALLLASSNTAILNLISPLNGLVYSPTIEPEHDDAVLVEGAHEAFRQGHFHHVPYIIGFNSEESVVLQEMLDYLRVYLVSYDLLPTNLVPEDMNLPKISLNYIEAGYKIKLFYFGILSAVARRADILQFISDTQFIKAIRETVHQISKYAPVYLYEFSYEGLLGIKGVNMDKPIKGEQSRAIEGVGHSEEVWYLFKRENLVVDNYYDAKKSDIFLSLWTNFAKYGHPTPHKSTKLNIIWPSSDLQNNFTYLDIGDELTINQLPRRESMRFWDDMYDKYAHSPFDTY